MRNLKENLELLESFKALEKGWNGYDADQIDNKAIERAIEIVSKLTKQPEIFPTANDSVQLEYTSEKGYLEFEIFRDRISGFQKTDKGKESMGILTDREMAEAIGSFLVQVFIAQNEVEYSDNLIDANDIPKIEKIIGVSLGSELRTYILTYGYLAYKCSELYGITTRQFLESDLVKQTLYLHSCYPETLGFVVIENQGEGDYYLVDAKDNVFEFDSEVKSLTPTSRKMSEYIVQRFESIKYETTKPL